MIGDNIKALREKLGLTQQKFADRLFIKQNSLALIESNKRNISSSLLKLISYEFNARLEWLETGEGEMRNTSNETLLKQFENLSPQSRELVKYFLMLPSEVRDKVAEAVAMAAELYPRKTEAEQPHVKPDNELTPDEAAEIVRHERAAVLAAEKRATSTSSASTGTSGLSKKFGSSP